MDSYLYWTLIGIALIIAGLFTGTIYLLVIGFAACAGATAAAVRTVANTMKEPGGMKAAKPKVADLYIETLGNLKKCAAMSALNGAKPVGGAQRAPKANGPHRGPLFAAISACLAGFRVPKAAQPCWRVDLHQCGLRLTVIGSGVLLFPVQLFPALPAARENTGFRHRSPVLI